MASRKPARGRAATWARKRLSKVTISSTAAENNTAANLIVNWDFVLLRKVPYRSE